MAEGLIYHNYDTNKSENSLCLGEHWPLVKDVKIRLRKNWLSVLAERKVPEAQRRNCRWCDELMINYGYGLCNVRHGLCNQKLMNE